MIIISKSEAERGIASRCGLLCVHTRLASAINAKHVYLIRALLSYYEFSTIGSELYLCR